MVGFGNDIIYAPIEANWIVVGILGKGCFNVDVGVVCWFI